MNNNKTRGISGLSILLCVLVLAGVYWFMSQSGVQQTAYTYQDFQKDLKKEKVESVEIKQNKVAPTGTLKIRRMMISNSFMYPMSTVQRICLNLMTFPTVWTMSRRTAGCQQHWFRSY